MSLAYTEIDRLLNARGLLARGAFRPRSGDQVPGAPRWVVLVGNAGPAMWAVFAEQRRSEPDPLDAWTRRSLAPVARALRAVAVYPFEGPPFRPFQRWAARAEGLQASPLGLSIHPVWGLWHAYRGALLLDRELDAVPAVPGPSPCTACTGRPCLAACPVGAFARTGYAVASCRRHLAGAAGGDCLSGGCLARHACPVGRRHAYLPDQAAFHMRAFLEAGAN